MTTEDKVAKYDEIVAFLLKNRDINKSNMEEEAIEEDGYFDVDSYSGGNIDDAYTMGKDNGEAQLIEHLLYILDVE